MGAVKIDTASREKVLDDLYPMDKFRGIYALLANIHHMREMRFVRGDYDACNLLLDFYDAYEAANLTERQREILRLVFEKDMRQQDVALEMGISQQAVSDHVKAAVQKIARVNRQREVGIFLVQG